MRVIFTSRDDMAQYVTEIMGHLNKILVEISRNPSNPRFNHYVFESFGALVRWVIYIKVFFFLFSYIIINVICVLLDLIVKTIQKH